MAGIPPPPPPAPINRGPTPGPGGNFGRPQPPPNFRPQGGAPGPQGMPMQMPIRQQMPMQNGTRISNITPPKIMSESDALRLLTTLKVFTIRKVTPNNPREKATWAIAEVSEERLAQPEIISHVKRLNESRKTVSDKKMALAPFQTTQVNNVLDGLISNEMDPNFEWALVQLDSLQKDIPVRDRGEKKKRETVTLTVYAKRTPLVDRNPVVLYHQLERVKLEREREQQNQRELERMSMERAREQREQHERMMMQEAMRPHPQPQPQPQPQRHPGQHPGTQGAPGPAHGVINLGKNGGGHSNIKAVRSKHGASKKSHHHESDSSSSSSYSGSESDSDGFGTSKSSASSLSDKKEKRRHSINRGYPRSQSRNRPEVRTLFLEGRSPSPGHRFREGRRFSEYGGISQRPYVPEVPRMIPTIDPISSAYQAGKEDAMAERFGSADRQAPSPVIIERIIERPQARPQPVISYGRPEARYMEPRRLEPRRFIEERDQIVDDYSHEDDYIVRRQEAAEEYIRSPVEPRAEFRRIIEPRQFARRQSSPARVDRFSRLSQSPDGEFFGRRSSMASPVRMKFENSNPFSPVSLPRRYEAPSVTDSYDRDHRDHGW